MKKIIKSVELSKINLPHDMNDPTFKIIFDQSPISSQIFSPDGTLIAVNKAWEKLWGVKLSEIAGYNILKDKQLIKIKIMPLIKRAFKGETVFLPPVRYEPNKTIEGVSDVEYRWTQSLIYAIKDNNGKILKVVLQHDDITEDKRREDELKVHSQVLESMDEGVSISNQNGVIIYTNPAEDRMFGYKRGELIGKHVSVQNSYPPRENKRIVNDVIKQLKIKGHWTGEWNNKKKDGATFITSARITAIEIGGKKHWVCVQEDITARNNYEEELRKREEYFRTSFEQTAVGISHTSLDGKWMRVNQKLCDMLGYSKDELLSCNFQKITHPDDLQISLDAVKRLTKGGKTTYSFEKRYIRKNGTIFWANLTISLLKDSKGRNKHFISVIEDITRRKKAEEDLRNERMRIYNLFMQAPAMIAVLKGPDFIFELANPLYLKGTGKKESIIGKRLLDALPEVKGQPILDILSNVFATGKPFIGNEIMVKLDINNDGIAEDTYFNFVYQPTFDAHGKIDGIMTHAIDVTAQVRARLQIEETEKQFRALADNIPNLAWMADATGYIFWYNSKWYEYTGTTPKEMEGWGWRSVQHPDALPKVLIQWKNSIKTGEPFNMVFPIKGADGTFRPFLTRVNPIKDHSGKVIRWFGTNTDITEQKELENQKDEFLAIASHELKTPVTSIKAYGQVLQRTFEREGNTRAVSQLVKMDAQINKLTSLIADLLDVTKIQSGKLIMQEENFDFNYLIVEVLEELQRTTERHTFIKYLAETVQIYGDKERVSQVVTNIISNAIKYSPQANKIIIKSKVEKDSVTLCVQDFGIGIPNDKKDKVFEQFFRVSGEKQHTFPGLGLGLYISNEIIKRQDGSMWVESVEGKGSTFCFKLPTKRQKNQKIVNHLDEERIKHE